MLFPSAKGSILYWQFFLLIALALVRGLIYLSIFPPWQAPDEPAHFEVVRAVAQQRQIPSQTYYNSEPVNAELAQSLVSFRFWELAQRYTPTPWLTQNPGLENITLLQYPYIGHLIYADTYPILPHILLFPALVFANSLDIVTELYLLRFISVLMFATVVALAWLVSRQVFPDNPQSWLAIAAFVLFLPMHTYIFSLLNTDTFAILLGAGLVWLLVTLFNSELTKKRLALLVGLVVLAIFIKRSVIFVTAWVGVSMVLYIGYQQRWPLKKILLVTGAIGSVILLVLFLILLNPGIFPAVTTFNIRFIQRVPILSLISEGTPPVAVAKIYAQSVIFFLITLVGAFGWANVNIPWPWFWGLLMPIFALVGLGAVVYLYKVFRKQVSTSRKQRAIFVVFLLGMLLAVISTFFPVLVSSPTWSPPARYFFPVIIPFATFFFLGVWQWCPARYRHTWLLPVWLICLVGFDTLALIRVILPYLYG